MKICFFSVVSIVLAGCVSAPGRADPDAFVILQEDRISPSNVQAFAGCLMDGFDKSHFVLTNTSSRQQRRADSYRIETLAGTKHVLVSADVFDNGLVTLNEAKGAALINTSGERDSFRLCLSKFAIAK